MGFFKYCVLKIALIIFLVIYCMPIIGKCVISNKYDIYNSHSIVNIQLTFLINDCYNRLIMFFHLLLYVELSIHHSHS